MHVFDKWLMDRLVAGGCLRLGDQPEDVPAGIRLFQESVGLAVTGEPDDLTVYELRKEASRHLGASHVMCLPIPSSTGSQFLKTGVAA